MHVADANAVLVHVFGQVFGHTFRQHCDERAVTLLRNLAHFIQEVVDLRFCRTHFNDRIDQARRANDLLGKRAAGLLEFPARGSGGNEDRLRAHRIPLFEAERAIVHAGRQAEATLGEGGFTPEVAAEHAADLRHRDVAFVGEDESIVGQIFEERRRRIARIAARQIARIIFDAGARARRLHHLHIERRALFETLRFEELAGIVKLVEALFQLGLDRLDRLLQRRFRRHIVGVGVELHERKLVRLSAGQRVEFDDALDFVAEHREAPGAVFQVGRENFDGITACAKRTADEVLIIAAIVEGDEVRQQLIARQLFADTHGERHSRIGFDRADTVDARNGRDDDHVVAFEQSARCGVAHAVDLFVDRCFFFDVGVRARHVGFGLIIVVIRDEIFDRVIREEALELTVELRCQRLVRGEYQCGPLRRLNDVRHREGLAGTCHAEQNLVVLVLADAFDKLGDRLRLVAPRFEFGSDPELDAAFALFRALRAMRHEHWHIARYDRMRRHQRLAREQRLSALRTFRGLRQQRGQTVGQAFAAHRRTWAGLSKRREARETVCRRFSGKVSRGEVGARFRKARRAGFRFNGGRGRFSRFATGRARSFTGARFFGW